MYRKTSYRPTSTIVDNEKAAKKLKNKLLFLFAYGNTYYLNSDQLEKQLKNIGLLVSLITYVWSKVEVRPARSGRERESGVNYS
jgi:hypothetical protein